MMRWTNLIVQKPRKFWTYKPNSYLALQPDDIVLFFRFKFFRWCGLFALARFNPAIQPCSMCYWGCQRWSPRGRPWPRGQILKSLALALASRPQVLENWPVLGSRTALFFGMLKFCGGLEKLFGKRFLVEIAWKIFVKTFFFFFFFFFFWRSPEKFLWRPFFFFFLESTCALCPWSLALASSISVLGLESVCPRKGCPWPWPRIFFVSLALALASSLVSSTPPLEVAINCLHIPDCLACLCCDTPAYECSYSNACACLLGTTRWEVPTHTCSAAIPIALLTTVQLFKTIVKYLMYFS